MSKEVMKHTRLIALYVLHILIAVFSVLFVSHTVTHLHSMVYEQDFQKNRLIERYSPFATSYMLQMLKTLVKYSYLICVLPML